MKKTGLYCHIPFCASTCDFCSFYQEKPLRQDLDAYLKGMEIEFDRLPKGQRFNTIFWGGGTPSILSAKDLERLGQSMLRNINTDFSEWTIEMAPSTVKADKLEVLKNLGVTRFSMGVQSFDDGLLKELGRLHNTKQVYKALELIAASGIENLNLDLMFALPNQSLNQWESDLIEANRLGVAHLSTYCLTFEEDTALYVKLSQGALKLDQERERLFYERAWDVLESMGYHQYEISNFSRTQSRRCQHNINTWTMHDWIGCGPSAASQYACRRYKNTSAIDRWLEGLKSNSPNLEEVSQCDDTLLFIDSLVFGLRMNEGVRFSELKCRYPSVSCFDSVEALFDLLMKEGYLSEVNGQFLLTREGRLKCDAIGSELLHLV